MFLTYPYLLGHSLFNVKDVPFMSLWMICTYYIYNVLDDYFSEYNPNGKLLTPWNPAFKDEHYKYLMINGEPASLMS